MLLGEKPGIGIMINFKEIEIKKYKHEKPHYFLCYFSHRMTACKIKCK